MSNSDILENNGERLPLHRKWRSQTFDQLVGQEHVVRTLKNAISAGRIAPAYLFSGPRGTGKTSMARILAKALNCPNQRNGEPCNKCRVCREISDGSFLDVIEMDAASHTQVEKIREFIVEKVNFRPVEAQKKIYIIDEVHKLSATSFDALLKTIEEPPPFVVFILATTEPDKLPPTIISRCQRFDFKRISVKDIISHLKQIANEEKICIEEGALNVIAQSSEGALRDALVVLDQASSFTEGCITAGEILSLLGMTHTDVLFKFADIIREGNTRQGLLFIDEMYREGKDLQRLTVDLLEHFRRLLLVKMVREAESILEVTGELFEDLKKQSQNFRTGQILFVIKELMELHRILKEAGMERLLWENATVRLTRWDITPTLEALQKRVSALESGAPAVKQTAGKPAPVKAEEYHGEPPAEDYGFEKPAEPVKPLPLNVNDSTLWHQLLQAVKKEKIQVFPILQEEGAGKIRGEKYILTLSDKNVFNREIMQKHRKYLEDTVQRISGKPLRLEFDSTSQEKNLFESVRKPHDVFVQEVADIFGASPVDKPVD